MPSVCSRTTLRSVICGMNSRCRLKCDAPGQAQLVGGEALVLLEPGGRKAPDAPALPAHGLDEAGLVRQQPGDWMGEARLPLAGTGVPRSLDPPPVAHPGIQRFQG